MENYDPDNLAIRSEEKNSEKSSEQNIKDNGQGKTTSNSTENTVTNYEVNKTLQHVISQVGNISKLTVAVVVDGAYKTVAGKGGTETGQYVPRTQDELDKINSIVRGAVGYDPSRNDLVEVLNVPFENKPEVIEKENFLTTVFTTQRLDTWFDYGLKILFVIIGLMIFFKAKKKLGAIWEKQRVENERIQTARENAIKREEVMPKISNEPQLSDHLKAIALEKPTEIAKVIKTMMVEN
jgi:flagellar M-ring protein FliF